MYKRTITMPPLLFVLIAAATLAACVYGMSTFLTGRPPAGFAGHTAINYNACAVCGRNFADVLGSPWSRHVIYVNANVNQNEADEGPHIQVGTGVYCEHCAALHNTTPEKYTLYKACVQRVKDEMAGIDLNHYDQFLDQQARFLAACRKDIYGNDSITASPFTPPVLGLPPAGQPQINPVPIVPEGQKTIFKYSNPPTQKPAEVPQKTWDKKIGDQPGKQASLEPQPKPTGPTIDLPPSDHKPPPPPIDTYEQEVKVRQEQHEWQQKSYKEYKEQHKAMEDGTPAPNFAKLQHDYDLHEADKAAMAAWDNQPVHDFRGPDAPWLRLQKGGK